MSFVEFNIFQKDRNLILQIYVMMEKQNLLDILQLLMKLLNIGMHVQEKLEDQGNAISPYLKICLILFYRNG